jgi:YggT family protein
MLLFMLISAISQLIDIVVMVVIVQFVLSLLIAFNVVNTHNKAVDAVWTALNAILDPLLNPIRRVLPNTGGVDFSPMILIFGLRLLVQLLYYLALAATSV